jgi:ADP-L-glycero-D-manno-heptose 6-epimerase
MILITGGAGFIGSIVQQALDRQNRATIVVDWLGSHGKWRNLANHPPAELVAPEGLDDYLASHPPIEAVVHMGAVSETTASDGDLTWETNVALSQRLWRWCAAHDLPFIYASSAATYGDGAQGFEDDAALDYLQTLRPLNLYAWTKHAFDLWVAQQIAGGAKRPPHWAGLKFFNVYGPNEYHKGKMISVVKVKHDDIVAGGPPKLFRSDRADVIDGEQRRDFIWVGDVVDVILWLLHTPSANGLFNVGTGRARSYLDLAHAVCRAAGQPEAIEFIDMPAALRGQYQSFTEASPARLRAAGYAGQFTPLEEGVRRYVQDYLRGEDMFL